MNVRRLTREKARRIAIRAQLLDADRPADLLTVAEQLTFLQLDPTAVVAPNADLVAWTRIGNPYSPAHLSQAMQDRTMFEHRGQDPDTEPVIAMVRPMSNLGLYLADMAAWPFGRGSVSGWLAANEGFRRRLLDQLRDSGPLMSRDIADTAELSWASTGWTNDRNVNQMLEFLSSRGEVAVAGRKGRQRIWDLAERIHPAGTVVVPADEARAIRDAKRLRAFGVARPLIVGEAGVDVEIDGTAGLWRLDPGATAEGFVGRTALLSPFDRLIHNRVRALELFDFEYTLEMYKPKELRRWGYFALPILHNDQLVGKVDAAADRKAGVLQVHALHEDIPFKKATAAAVRSELAAMAEWLGLDGGVRYT